MLSKSGKAGSYVVGHVSDPVISWGSYQKAVQIIFLEELINILNKGQSYERNIDKKVDDFF